MASIDFKALLMNVSGRLNRMPYNLAYAGLYAARYIISMILYLIVLNAQFGSAVDENGYPTEAAMLTAELISVVLASFFVVYPFYVISVKRFNDRVYGARMRLSYFVALALTEVVFYVLSIIATVTGLGGFMLFMLTIWFLIAMYALWIQIDLTFRKGTSGPNQYGPDPLRA